MVLMLALAMLFGVGATAVSAIDAGKENEQIVTDVNNTGNVENLTGWFDITSGPDGIKITLTPDKAAIKGISKAQIKALATDLVDAIKELVKEDVVGGIMGDASLTDGDFFTTVLDNYIAKENYADSLDFFKAVVSDPAVEARFIDYVCNTLVANAIKFGVITEKDIPTAEKIADTINGYIDGIVDDKIEEITNNLDDYAKDFVDGLAADYVTWLLGDDSVKINPDVEGIVNGKIAEYVGALAASYLDGDFKNSTDPFEQLVNGYFDDELYTKLIDNVSVYLDKGTTNNTSLDALIKGAISEYVYDHFVNNGGYEEYVEEFVVYVKTGVVEKDEGETDKDVEDMKKLYDGFIADINGNIDVWLTNYLANKIDKDDIIEGNLLASFLDGKYNDEYLTAEIKKEAGNRLDAALKGENPSLYADIVAELDTILANKDSDEYKAIEAEFDAKVAGVIAGNDAELEKEFKNELLAQFKQDHPEYDENTVDTVFEEHYRDNRETLINDYVTDNKTALINTYINDNKDSIIKDYVADNRDTLINDYVTDNKDSLILDAYEEIRKKWADANGKSELLDEIWTELLAKDADGKLVNADLIDTVIKDEIELFWEIHSDDEFVHDYALTLWNSSVGDAGHKAEIKALIQKKLNEGSSANRETLINQVIGGMKSEELVAYLRAMVNGEDVTDEQKEAVEKKINEKINSAVYNADGTFTAEVQAIVNDKLASVTADVKAAIEKGDISKLDQTIQDKINELCTDNFGVDYIGLFGTDGRLAAITAAFKESYTKALETKPFAPEDILNILKDIQIGAHGDALHVIYEKPADGGPKIYIEAIKELLKTVPTPKEILESEEETFVLSYDLVVSTFDFDPISFNVTVEAAGESLDYMQRALRVIADHIDFGVAADGTIVLDVKMPKIFTDAVLRACQTSRIPESIKDKVFTALSKTPDDAYALFMDLTYDEVMTLIEKVDFNEVLNKDSVSKYVDFVNKYIPDVDLKTLETEDLVAKLEEYAGHFNTLKYYVAKAYSYVPAKVGDLSVVSFYQGNGVFGGDVKVESFDLKPIIFEVVSRINEEYAPYIINLLDNTTISNVAFDLSVSFCDIYKIEFYKPGEATPYRVGFLPVGADLADFADLTIAGGYKVNGWLEVDGALNPTDDVLDTKMPARDTKVVAVVASEEIIIDPLAIELKNHTYDGTEFTTELITSDKDLPYTLEIIGGDKGTCAGSYTAQVKATVKSEYKYTHAIVVGGEKYQEYVFDCEWTVAKATVNVESTGTSTEGKLVYNGKEQTVEIKLPTVDGDIITVTVDQDSVKGTDAGTYIAKVILTLTEAAKDNYIITVDGSAVNFADGASYYTVEWNIQRAPITVTDITLVKPDDLVYTGYQFEVYFDAAATLADGTDAKKLIKITHTASTATDAGPYTAKGAIDVTDRNYIIVVGDTEYTDGYALSEGWAIAKRVIRPDDFTVTKKPVANTFAMRLLRARSASYTSAGTITFDGTEQTVVLDYHLDIKGEMAHSLSEILLVEYIGDNKATNAGKYYFDTKIKINPESPYAHNYVFEVYNSEDDAWRPVSENETIDHSYEWVIAPKEINISDIKGAFALTGNEGLIYDGSEKTVTLSVALDSLGEILPGIKYSDIITAALDTVGAKGIDARSYTAKVILTLASDNYKLVGEEITLAWAIAPRPIELPTGEDAPVLSVTEFVYNGKEQSVEVVGFDTSIFSVTLTDGTKRSVGTYIAHATFTVHNTNYVFKDGAVTTASFTWTIAPKTFKLSELVLTPEFDSVVYDGEAKTFVLMIGNEEFAVDGISVVISYKQGTATLTEAKNAGKYTVSATVTVAAEHEGGYILEGEVAPVQLEIQKAKIVLDESIVLVPDGFTLTEDGKVEYDGDEKAFILKGDTEFGFKFYTVYYKDESGNETTVAPVNAGVYTVRVELLEPNSNYEYDDKNGMKTKLEELNLSFTVTPAVINLDDFTLTPDFKGSEFGTVDNVFYADGIEKIFKLVGNGGKTLPAFVNASVVYKNAKGETVAAPTEIGTYTVALVYEIDEAHKDNYKLTGEVASVSFEIKAQTEIDLSGVTLAPDGFTLTDGKIVYDRNAKAFKLVFTGENPLDGVGYALYTDSEGNVFATAPTGVGTYKVSVVLTGASAYSHTLKNAPEAIEFTVTPYEVDRERDAEWIVDFVWAPGIEMNPTVKSEWIDAEIIHIDGNDKPGTYSVTFKLTLKDEVNTVLKGTDTYTLIGTVEKANINVEEILPDSVTADYDGKIHKLGEVNLGAYGTYITVSQTLESWPGSTPDYRSAGVYKYVFVVTVRPEYADFYMLDGGATTVTYERTVTIVENEENIKNNTPIIGGDKEVGNVFAENGIPKDYEMIAKDVTHLYDECEFTDELKKIELYNGKLAKVLLAYDLSFIDEDGNVRDVKDNFVVTLDVSEAIRNNSAILIVFINDDGEVAEVFERVPSEGNTVAFSTTHFSAYAIVELVDDVDGAEKDSFPWWIILVIALAVIAVVVVIIIIVKKKSDKPTEPTEPTEEPTEPTDGTDTEEAPAEEAPAEEAPAEEAPVEEVPAEEAPVEEAPVEEAPAEEAPVEEAPVEEPKESASIAPSLAIPIVTEKSAEEETFGQRIINGQVVLVSYRSSYMSRLIQSDTDIQDYYTVIKNTLLSYKGVKSRISWNFESFNKGRIQCVKLNLKGRALLVYIGLDPNEYNVNKYHFTDVSDKPKFEKVPMLMKVKSDRGLKYVIELIEEMMAKLGIERGDMPSVDYHMPYETTEALVERDLVKVILPPGVTLDENASIASIDVSELIDNASKATEAAPVEEAPTVEEVHVDAVHADELVTNEEAEAKIEIIERTVPVSSGTKFVEINLDTICDNYEDDETVDLESLKSKRLVNKNAGKLKVLARGVMTKRLVIIADKFSLQAVKMITLAGGHAEQLK